MSRPIKKSLDYFIHHTDFSLNETGQRILGHTGIEGYGLYFCIREEIGRRFGYFLPVNGETITRFAPVRRMTINDCKNYIEKFVDIGLFNEDLYREYGILTNESIQTEFLSATRRRTNIKIINEYWLLDKGIENFEFANV